MKRQLIVTCVPPSSELAIRYISLLNKQPRINKLKEDLIKSTSIVLPVLKS